MIDEYIGQYGKRLYGLCMSLTKAKDDADDLYQETWLKVCLKISQYDEKRPFEAWLTGICVNTYRDLLRKRKKAPQTQEAAENLPCLKENTEEALALRQAIDTLPQKMRITVILHYFHDLDEKKTAAALGIPTGTVKSRLNKAKKLLKEALENERTAL